ncbi:MAG: glycosyltransferase family 2 protein [Desulfomonile tiedjei]|uniref:Glycosyltransferase family 2 protein n=1 Tax=Desulfomonile tiedjei TaxID=2358 RepID=A0A9D6V1E0_9BACT|nr:glycosyltransferase family 2 protein [Desulfomonile tiedjei]
MTLQPLPSVSVCFPAYNEEETLEGILRKAHHLMAGSGVDYEILVCNDGSTDRTGQVAEACAAELPNFTIFHNLRNCGIRYTFEFLYSRARKDYVFLNSTDGQWETALVLDMLPMTADWDIIIASRSNKQYGLARALISKSFNLIPRLLFGTKTYDAGAVKLVKREIINRFRLVSTSPFNEAERLIYATRAGYRITEHPVQTATRKTGRARGVNVGVLVGAILDVFRVWWVLARQGSPRA